VPRRLVFLGIAIALLAVCSGAIVAACYDVPRPDCGFQCGPSEQCPDGYVCGSDQRCHRIGAPSTLVCDPLDAAVPVDAMIDAARDATALGNAPPTP
jgi:hypothetical protein